VENYAAGSFARLYEQLFHNLVIPSVGKCETELSTAYFREIYRENESFPPALNTLSTRYQMPCLYFPQPVDNLCGKQIPTHRRRGKSMLKSIRNRIRPEKRRLIGSSATLCLHYTKPL